VVLKFLGVNQQEGGCFSGPVLEYRIRFPEAKLKHVGIIREKEYSHLENIVLNQKEHLILLGRGSVKLFKPLYS
jgi:hypothetical protein